MKKKPRESKCRAISISITPSDEDWLLVTYRGTFSEAIREALSDARMYRLSIQAPGVKEDGRDKE